MRLQLALLTTMLLLLTKVALSQELFGKEEKTLADHWDLGENAKTNADLFVIHTYKPVYLLAGKVSNNVNRLPYSDNPDRNITEPIPLNKTEQLFQLSLKTKVFNNLFGARRGGDVWVGYTQASFWQVFNTDLSRPFRETNYEPELMFILPVNYRLFGMEGVFVGIGLNHQSNGRSNPLSRSWNRIIAQVALQGEYSSLVVKPWWRLPESIDEDDNPGIENYMGRSEAVFAWQKGIYHFNCTARHSLRFGENNRGSLKIAYAVRVYGNLKVRAQVFSGYGESMIDYNHRQTVVGLGFSLVEW
ncbi:phospholipase A [uncultured Draconibacterium sp.]|uniref:phospholipase A n=1 Tax=uncultured Draconibacterium sp. TaxID=1573823 RepID=UPI0025CF36A2|nr:phospholipase A [uncultured Draconibacterium sp.]